MQREKLLRSATKKSKELSVANSHSSRQREVERIDPENLMDELEAEQQLRDWQTKLVKNET